METFVRKKYLDAIEPFIGKEPVKVLTGMRRCGKSTVLDMISHHISEKGAKPSQIIKLDFESKKTPQFADGDELYEYLIKKSGKKKTYILLDEIQNIDGWEKCIRSLTKDIDSDIYITGSSSKMLSGEMATHLAGRYVEIEINPFSFSEVSEIIDMDKKELFTVYLKNGGMPLIVMNGYDDRMTDSILSAMYDSVIINDIAERNQIRDVPALKKIMAYIVSETGHTISAKNIADYLKSQKKKISVDTVLDYFEYAEDAMFFRKAKRYDLRGKEVLKTEYKCYLTDIGIRETLGFGNLASIEQILENIVYNELRDRGFEVYVGKIGNGEIDFVAKKKAIVEYYQVTYLMNSKKTADREFDSLLSIEDNHPKYIISMDEIDMSRNGIIHRNIIDWLSERRRFPVSLPHIRTLCPCR